MDVCAPFTLTHMMGKGRAGDSSDAGAKGSRIGDDERAVILAQMAVLLQRRRRRRRRTAAFLVVSIVIGVALARAAWTNVDSDGDGISNCRERAGLRTSEPTTIWETSPTDSDTDGDGIIDGEEATLRHRGVRAGTLVGLLWSCSKQTFVALADPTLADTDDDGLDDPVELSDGSSAFSADSDDDGLSDADEQEWGSDPNNVDTDGDGFRDGDDADADFTPVEAEERIAKRTWALEYAEGVMLGDVKESDSVPQLLGSISGGSSSVIPVIGWITGSIADLRDVVANSIQGDWVSAGASGAGLLPYAGDTAKASKQLTQFVAKHPDKCRAVVTAILAWEKLPSSVGLKLLQVADATNFDKLREHGLSDEEIVRFAKRGTQLASLVIILDKVGGHLLQGVPAANADDEGFVASLDDAENALREYAKDADDTADVASESVYVGGFPEGFIGGRLIDSCTKCTPLPELGESTLRVAKVGFQPYSDTIRNQIHKDAYLKDQGYGIEWHFFPGPTGLTIDPRLLDALDSTGIRYYVHMPG